MKRDIYIKNLNNEPIFIDFAKITRPQPLLGQGTFEAQSTATKSKRINNEYIENEKYKRKNGLNYTLEYIEQDFESMKRLVVIHG